MAGNAPAHEVILKSAAGKAKAFAPGE